MRGVDRLTPDDEPAVRELLAQDPAQNLFLLGFLDAGGMLRAAWYGVRDSRGLQGLALMVAGRLCVPWCPDPAHAGAIGKAARSKHPPSMMVGPRLACDALWDTWAVGHSADRYYDQRLYVADVIPHGDVLPGLRLARSNEAVEIARYAATMELEDLGRDPSAIDPGAHLQGVKDRIRSNRTWIIEEDGRIVFLIHVGTASSRGCQVGGTFVPKSERGRGLATKGMRTLLHRLIPEHGMVTLHVNEANTPAVRCYEASGFRRSAPFRLITVKS